MEFLQKEAFHVIGKAGSTRDGDGFIGRLWEEATAHYSEVSGLAKTDAGGSPVGFWGVMTDFGFRFLPWENDFTEGRYMAGVECREDAEAPAGWEKWTVPGFSLLKGPVHSNTVFRDTLEYLQQQGMTLAGAVQDFTDPADGQNDMLFPVGRESA